MRVELWNGQRRKKLEKVVCKLICESGIWQDARCARLMDSLLATGSEYDMHLLFSDKCAIEELLNFMHIHGENYRSTSLIAVCEQSESVVVAPARHSTRKAKQFWIGLYLTT